MLSIQFHPFPEMNTGRILLRQLDIADAAEIFFLRSDEGVLKYTDLQRSVTIDDAIAFIHKINTSISKNESIYWAIADTGNNKLIGTICLWNISTDQARAEIGYALHPDFQGRGIMQEAITAVIGYGFNTMQLHSFEADVHPGNTRSILLLERNGFTREPVTPDNNDGLVMYSLLKK